MNNKLISSEILDLPWNKRVRDPYASMLTPRYVCAQLVAPVAMFSSASFPFSQAEHLVVAVEGVTGWLTGLAGV